MKTQTTSEISDALEEIQRQAKLSQFTAKAVDRIAQARIDLVLGRDAKAVFFATIAMRLKMVAATDLPTAATDGRQIRYNPEFICGLSRAEAVGLIAHEVMHISNAHHARMGERDPKTWNIAADLAINPLLADAGIDLPAGGLFPEEGPYSDLPKGLSAEEYYTLLQDPNRKKKGGGEPGDGDGGNDPGQCGGVEKPGKGSPAECRKAEAEAREATAAAQQAAESSNRGSMPAGLGRNVSEILEPTVDWRDVLRQFVARAAKNDYCWSRPNRRYIHAGLYLPGLYSEELGDVVLAVDTSGSIGEKQLSEFAAEAQGILEAYDTKLTILYHDSKVAHVQEWRSTDGPLVLEPKGGGGTSHVPVFEHIANQNIDAACIVCLTDMYTEFPAAGPEIPTLWCNCGRPGTKAPFGAVVDIKRSSDA